MKRCAYCGKVIKKGEREHVFPRCLYPESKNNSKVQRITVLSCSECNRSFADDEAHFRDMLSISGDPNQARKEIWKEGVEPSFDQPDGHRRVNDLFSQMKPVRVENTDRYMVYPGKDPRVLRVITKIIRGLSHYHNIETAVPEKRVRCSIQEFPVPEDILYKLKEGHRESDIITYQYGIINEDGISSFWMFTFYEVIKFIGAVLQE